MQNLDCLWSADKNQLIKFFKDAPSMDIQSRMKYFHDVFPYAEILPVNFYLFDSNEINLACNQTTIFELSDKSITDYVGYTIKDYSINKGWPAWTFEDQMENNRIAILQRHVVGHEFSKEGKYAKKWLSKKDAFYDDNGKFLGIIGISMLAGLGCESIHWDAEKKKIKLILSEDQSVDFSEREFSVLQGLLNGGTAQDIAENESISEKTIETYITRIKIKLDCQKQREITSLLIQRELAHEIIRFKHG